MAALVDNTVGDRLGGMSTDSTKSLPNFWMCVLGLQPLYLHACTCGCMCVYTHTHTHTHTHYPSLQSLLSLGIICPRNLLPTRTKSSTGLPYSDRSPVQVTHPNPPAGIWATATFLKILWVPAACEGKGLQPAATNNWCPQSSVKGPGPSGRRQKSGKHRASGGECRLLSIWPTAEGRRASPHKSLPLDSPLRQVDFQTECYGTLY